MSSTLLSEADGFFTALPWRTALETARRALASGALGIVHDDDGHAVATVRHAELIDAAGPDLRTVVPRLAPVVEVDADVTFAEFAASPSVTLLDLGVRVLVLREGDRTVGVVPVEVFAAHLASPDYTPPAPVMAGAGGLGDAALPGQPRTGLAPVVCQEPGCGHLNRLAHYWPGAPPWCSAPRTAPPPAADGRLKACSGPSSKRPAGCSIAGSSSTACCPCVAFLGCCLLTVAAATGGVTAAVTTWQRQDATVKVIHVVAFLVVAHLTAAWLASAATSLVRFYEGYWPRLLGRPPRALGVRWHRDRLAALDPFDDADYARLHTGYPADASEVMPTRLGNILKNAELHPEDRYGIDAVVVWPRLYPLLPRNSAPPSSPPAPNWSSSSRSPPSPSSTAPPRGSSSSPSAPGSACSCSATPPRASSPSSPTGPVCPAPGCTASRSKSPSTSTAPSCSPRPAGRTPPTSTNASFWQALARHWYRGIPPAVTHHAAAAGIPPDDPPRTNRPGLAAGRSR